MFCMDNGMLRRLSLAFLLLLLLFSMAGHALQTVDGAHHALSESTCAFHHGMNAPMNMPRSWVETGISPEPVLDQSGAFGLVLNIPHPPTF